uniref:Uncharacterized protein n=1 Tax=Denticeps clupeoides TaxID=299321 RepID=A0A8C3Z6Q4_9TELE
MSNAPSETLVADKDKEESVTELNEKLEALGVQFRNPFEDYELLEVIGKGVSCKVHKARHRKTGQIVPVPLVLRSVSLTQPEFLAALHAVLNGN